MDTIKQAFSFLMQIAEMDCNHPESDSLLTENNSEPSCSFTRRQNKKNPLKGKRRNVCHEGLELENEETPGKSRTTETASCSGARNQSRKKFLKRKCLNICHEEPEHESDESSGKSIRTETETEENIVSTVNVRRISLYRTAKLHARYNVNGLLGEGGLGAVYSGVRKTDGKKVAIKFACKTEDAEYITLPGDTRRLPLEVALMELMSKPPRCPYVIELLEWFDAPKSFILILERPELCIDLFTYCSNITLSDISAQLLIHKIAVAASHCLNRGVFHRDIKEENILINPNTFDVKLIDFGCGDLLKEFYVDYSGTVVFAPPEVHYGDYYEAESATVWGLGILLYSLLCGHLPYNNKSEVLDGILYLPNYLSEGSCRLIMWCLEPDPDDRPTLEQFLTHDWF